MSRRVYMTDRCPDAGDLSKSEVATGHHLWVKMPGEKRWQFFEYVRWSPHWHHCGIGKHTEYDPDAIRVLIHDGARVQVAYDPDD